MFWIATREEYSLTDALDYQAIPGIKYVTLSKNGTPGATKSRVFNPKLNRLRRLEATKLEVPYLTISDPTPGNDLIFLNMFVQTLD